jgi:hypothetical protein
VEIGIWVERETELKADERARAGSWRKEEDERKERRTGRERETLL